MSLFLKRRLFSTVFVQFSSSHIPHVRMKLLGDFSSPSVLLPPTPGWCKTPLLLLIFVSFSSFFCSCQYPYFHLFWFSRHCHLLSPPNCCLHAFVLFPWLLMLLALDSPFHLPHCGHHSEGFLTCAESIGWVSTLWVHALFSSSWVF